MIAQILELLELRPASTRRDDRPLSTLAYDWIYTILMLMFTVGFMMDVWSHDTFGPDQSVFSEYHLLFYTCAALMGFWLVGSHMLNVNAGYRFEHALPRGYGFALIGVFGFGIAGGLDLLGHAIFGFENTDEALLSPTHLSLFIIWVALSSGPLLAMLARTRSNGNLNLWQSLPAIVSFVSVLIPFSIMLLTMYLPLGQSIPITQARRFTLDFEGTVAGFYIQTALLFGFTLWLVRNVKLPFGSLIIAIALYTLTLSLPFERTELFAGIAVSCGLALELLYLALQPTDNSVLRFRIFGFFAPIVLWLTYFANIIIFNIYDGISVTAYMWLGIVFQMGLIGLAIAVMMTLAPAPLLTSNEAKS